jgi:glycosyltransferase involved in cell wall biosynthesis
VRRRTEQRVNQRLVTIVTPSFNQGHFIRATIESVLSQQYPFTEYIIMDGGSTDATAAIAAEYSSRLKFISEKDRGQSHAINKGFRMAKGEIVSWLNSDDVILPGAVGHAAKALEEDPLLGAVYGEGYLIDYDGVIKNRFPATEPFNLWKLVYLSDYILQQTVYFRRSIFEELGYLDESLNWGMDWDILIRIGKRYPMRCLPEYMGCLREYGEAKTFSGGGRRFRELATILRRHGGIRYPPGYFTYGLDTYQKICCNFLNRISPAFLGGASRKLQQALSYGVHLQIARTLRESQGLYTDSWASRRLLYMLPAGTGSVVIRGTLPDLGETLRGQRLTVSSGGAVLAASEVGFGDFEITIPDAIASTEPLSLEINASKFVVPSKVGLGPDPRRLSYMLQSIERTRSCPNPESSA